MFIDNIKCELAALFAELGRMHISVMLARYDQTLNNALILMR
jgi:hypothetical protein